MDKLPESIYYVARGTYNNSRPYVSKGHVKQSLNYPWRKGRVYRAVTVWEDVTEEFINE